MTNEGCRRYADCRTAIGEPDSFDHQLQLLPYLFRGQSVSDWNQSRPTHACAETVQCGKNRHKTIKLNVGQDHTCGNGGSQTQRPYIANEQTGGEPVEVIEAHATAKD